MSVSRGSMLYIIFILKENRVSSCSFTHMNIEVETLLIWGKKAMKGICK
jgi:hypothetical protein